MKFLLDTHVWLWMIAEPDRFSSETTAVLENGDNQLLLSAASSWEIAIKFATGKLKLPAIPSKYVPDQVARTGVTPLKVEHSHDCGRADSTLPQSPYRRERLSSWSLRRSIPPPAASRRATVSFYRGAPTSHRHPIPPKQIS